MKKEALILPGELQPGSSPTSAVPSRKPLAQSCCSHTGRCWKGESLPQPTVLVWAGVEILFFTAGGMGLYLGLLLETVVVTEGYFLHFLHKKKFCTSFCNLPCLHIINAFSASHAGSVWLAWPGGAALCLAKAGAAKPLCQGKQPLCFREIPAPCCTPHLWKSPAQCPGPACPLTRAGPLTLTLEDWEEKPKGQHRIFSQ